MRSAVASVTALSLIALMWAPAANGYGLEYTVPNFGGCPQLKRFDTSSGAGIRRRWSTSLPSFPTIFTTASPGSAAQLDEIQQTILDAFGAWSGVAGTRLASLAHPNALGPLQRTAVPDACASDPGTNLDGENSICLNQPSSNFTTGVLAFTRTFVAEAPGAAVGLSGPAAFAGQILEADIQVRNDGQATFATPAALASHPDSFDLESILIHELGHFLGLDHSAVWQAAMFPFAPPPGTFWNARPSPQAPDGPLADDDRTGLRALYPDPSDRVDVGVIAGHVLPANPLTLASLEFSSAGRPVTGIFGAHVVAVDADTGAVVAGVLAGWSCDPALPPVRFDGSYRLERLPVGRNYKIYVEPLDGVVSPEEVPGMTASVCRLDVPTPCLPPPANTNFVTRSRTAP
jgi:hypothetical protein